MDGIPCGSEETLWAFRNEDGWLGTSGPWIAGHDDDRRCGVAKEKTGGGKILAIDLAVLHGTVDFSTTIFER